MHSHILCNTPTKTPTRTPIKKKYSIPPTPPCSISGLVDYPPSRTSINYKGIFEMYGIVDHEPLVFQDGAKSNPYLTYVDTGYPERNGGMFGLEISYVSDIKHNFVAPS
eukprot:11309589-Ditylum_brightwellii.AAC.1